MKYTKEQQKAHRKQLIDALRSGKYLQGFGALRSEDKYCCLGVACDISNIDKWKKEPTSLYKYIDIVGYMPAQVMDFYGFSNKKGIYKDIDYIGTKQQSLALQNDRGMSFIKIADIIESEPEGLCV